MQLRMLSFRQPRPSKPSLSFRALIIGQLLGWTMVLPYPTVLRRCRPPLKRSPLLYNPQLLPKEGGLFMCWVSGRIEVLWGKRVDDIVGCCVKGKGEVMRVISDAAPSTFWRLQAGLYSSKNGGQREALKSGQFSTAQGTTHYLATVRKITSGISRPPISLIKEETRRRIDLVLSRVVWHSVLAS